MPRASRRDRKIRAAFKRQPYVPDPVNFADPWDDDLDVTDCDLEVEEEAEHEHA